MAKDKDKNKPDGKGQLGAGAAKPPEQPTPDDAADADALVEKVAQRVAEMIAPRLDEINEDLLRLGRDTEKLDTDQDQMRKSFADTLEGVEFRLGTSSADASVEKVAQRVGEMIAPRLDEITEDIKKRDGFAHTCIEELTENVHRNAVSAAEGIESLDNDQRKLSDTLAQLSDTYEDVKAITSTDWREFAGEEFAKAEESSLELGRARKTALTKLRKYEADNGQEKRNADPHYAKLKVDANNSAEKATAAKERVSTLKDAAMQAISS